MTERASGPMPQRPRAAPTGRRARSALALIATALVVLAVTLAVPLLVRGDADPGPPPGAVLDGPDRQVLDAVPIRRGPGPPPADPAVDLHDPVAVARAYLVAARAAATDDTGRTHLQAASYAAPDSPPAAVGVLVLDPPPRGQVRTAAVPALDLVAADDADRRRGYRATVATATGPPGGAGVPAVTTAYVVVDRQPDGRWLVTADTPDLPEGDD
ncbi:MAG: hypothetical protein QOK35_2504 [Pseudonocardiales bacterium]|nr:hypothetical protein [Pseudonocardiales bacterium]